LREMGEQRVHHHAVLIQPPGRLNHAAWDSTDQDVRMPDVMDPCDDPASRVGCLVDLISGSDVQNLSTAQKALVETHSKYLAPDRVAAMTSEDVPEVVLPIRIVLKHILEAAQVVGIRLDQIRSASVSLMTDAASNHIDAGRSRSPAAWTLESGIMPVAHRQALSFDPGARSAPDPATSLAPSVRDSTGSIYPGGLAAGLAGAWNRVVPFASHAGYGSYGGLQHPTIDAAQLSGSTQAQVTPLGSRQGAVPSPGLRYLGGDAARDSSLSLIPGRTEGGAGPAVVGQGSKQGKLDGGVGAGIMRGSACACNRLPAVATGGIGAAVPAAKAAAAVGGEALGACALLLASTELVATRCVAAASLVPASSALVSATPKGQRIGGSRRCVTSGAMRALRRSSPKWFL